MTEPSKTPRKAIVVSGAVIFAIGIILSWPGTPDKVSGSAGYGLEYLPENISVAAWGNSALLHPQPEASVWPNGQMALNIHKRAFDKLGIPLEKMDSIAVGYSLNDSPAEMVMVLTGTFDEKGLIASALKAENTEKATIEGYNGVSLSRGYVMVPVSSGQVVVGNVSSVQKGIAAPRKDWARQLEASVLEQPEGYISIAILDKSFYLPGITEARATVGIDNGLWVDIRLKCDSAETCDRFPAWLDFHIKEVTPGLTPDPTKTNAFLATVDLKMEEDGGHLTAGSPPATGP